jgi:hypothetical protein
VSATTTLLGKIRKIGGVESGSLKDRVNKGAGEPNNRAAQKKRKRRHSSSQPEATKGWMRVCKGMKV